jgi:hypothetical protein
MESSMKVPQKKWKIELPYNPVIPFLGVYPKECALEYDRATCTPMVVVLPS